MDIDRAHVAVPVRTPDTIEKLLSGQRQPGVLGQKRQEVEFPICQIHHITAAPHLAAPEVDLEITDRDDLLLYGDIVGAAKYGPHSSDQFSRRERFDEIIVPAELEAQNPIDLIVAAVRKSTGVVP